MIIKTHNLNIELDANILNEDFSPLYNYSDTEINEIKSFLSLKLEDENKEVANECKDLLNLITNYVYLATRIPLKNISYLQLKKYKDDELIKLKKSIVKILNKHITLYNDSNLSLYSKTIDVCVDCLKIIDKEMEYRKLNVNLTSSDKKEIQTYLTKWRNKKKSNILG